MNIYDDYGNYMSDTEILLSKLKSSNSSVLFCLNDVILVLDYIYRKHLDKAKIEADLEEIFEVGYGYIGNALNDIKTYYEEYFNSDIILFNSYANLIIYSILLEDVKAYLESDEKLTKEKEKILSNLLFKIDDVMVNNKEISSELLSEAEEALERILPPKNNYRPVYTVFTLIAEELGIY